MLQRVVDGSLDNFDLFDEEFGREQLTKVNDYFIMYFIHVYGLANICNMYAVQNKISSGDLRWPYQTLLPRDDVPANILSWYNYFEGNEI